MKPNTNLILSAFFVISLSSCLENRDKRPLRIQKDIIEQAAEDSLCPKVTPNLLRAVFQVESKVKMNSVAFEGHYLKRKSGTWEQMLHEFENATSHCKGQIMGKEARKYGVEPKELRADEETCVRLTALMLGKDICEREKGNIRYGVMAYNAGASWRKKDLGTIAAAAIHADKVMNVLKRMS